MEIIARRTYLDAINQWLGKNLIIVLTGQRRVGKSCILKLLAENCRQSGNVIYIDKEKHQFEDIQDYRDLNAYIDERIVNGQTNYIIIDEVQTITEFEKTLRSFYSEDNVEVIVSGSNAKMLSSELTTVIAGRYKEIYVQPLSYTEFMTFHNLPDDETTLMLYIEYGGMPGLATIGLDKNFSTEYLSDIYHTTLLKDVVMRNEIRNVTFMDRLVTFMADNEGKIISANSISKYLKAKGHSLSPSIIINYQKMLADAYIIHQVNRYDIHGKRIFESNEKYYFEDHGIRNAIVGGRRDADIEKIIENIVYQHLIRSGYTVYVGLLQAGEIDFVCSKPSGERIYIQVSNIVSDEQTREREFGNLRKINDNYPKYVISMTPLVSRNDDNGITHLHLRNFLVEGL